MALLTGHTLHRYQITGLVAEGGMGAVYKAHDPRLMREVAVKVMHSHFASQESFQERFMQEARTAARLDHPGIVKIFDSGEVNQILYIIMEFIPGPNLRHILSSLAKENRMILLPEAVQILRQICLALDYAHRHGVLHRDIKPDNIMLKPEPVENLPYRPVLTDLGLAKLLEGLPITREGESMGTPAYMSPEQALGLAVDARSDVYSLGILFYELIAGQLPFPVKTLSEAIRCHTKEPPPPPGRIRLGLPDRISNIILKCLEKEPVRRFRDASELAAELGSALSDIQRSIPSPRPDLEVSLITKFEASLPEVTPGFAKKARRSPVSGADVITVMGMDRTARSISISQKQIKIGRAEDNEIVIDDPKASRHHARVEIQAGEYRVIDLNSTNGTFLGNVALLAGVPASWTPDQLLRIGDTFLRLGIAEPGRPREEPAQELPRPETSTSIGTRAGITLEPAALIVNPGGSATLNAAVTNQSPVVDHFTLSMEGIPPEWLASAPPEAQLLPGEQHHTSMIIQPPFSPKSRAGAYPLAVKVISRIAPKDTVETKAILTVTPFYRFEASLRPQRQRSSGNGSFTVDLRNLGNADLTIAFSGSDPEEGCQYIFSPGQILVRAGEECQAQLNVRPKAPLAEWLSRTFMFSVTAKGGEAAGLVQQLRGEFEQVAPSLEMSLRPQRQKGAGQGTFSVQLTNQGQSTLNMTLEAADPENACSYIFFPARLTLSPGESRAASLTVQPKSGVYRPQVKVYPFSVTARVAEFPGLSRQVFGEWEQSAYDLEMSLNPNRQIATGQALFNLQLCNRSDVQLQVELQASDPSNVCRYMFNTPQFNLPVGEVHRVDLRVSPASPLTFRSGKVVSFEVTARPVGSPGVIARAQGEWEEPASQAVQGRPAAPPKPVGIPEPVRLEAAPPIWQPEAAAPPKPATGGACAIWVIGTILTIISGILFGNIGEYNSLIYGVGPMEHAVLMWFAGLVLTAVLAGRVKNHKPSKGLFMFAIGVFLVLVAWAFLGTPFYL